MSAVPELAETVGTARACRSLAVPRASWYRRRRPRGEPRPRRPSPRALSAAECEQVLAVLYSERFCDRAPAQVVATLLDEGVYLASARTMYRLLAAQGATRERRDQLTHPPYAKPKLLATGPNQVWSWDITKLRGPVKWSSYSLYVILDIFSRYVVGWMVADGESASLAQTLIQETCAKQQIEPGQLTLHADRGSSMRSRPVALLLADLGITKTHSRPYVSDDNPFSESQFKTLKYRPDFPDRFDSLEHARSFCRTFFLWYNQQHRHSGIALLTPEDVHYGRVQQRLDGRQKALERAYRSRPERFVQGPPSPKQVPRFVAINPPRNHDQPAPTDTAAAP
jgi:putative transposase